MTNDDAMKDYPLMAYMDGQLSESDAAAFEQALTPEQKQILEADKVLQDRLVRALREKDMCPDGLWRKVQDDLAREDGPVRKLRVFAMVAAAACLVLGLALIGVYLVPSDEPVEHMVSFAATTGQFAELASIRGDQATIAQALTDNGFAVQMADIAESNRQHRHRVNLLGMNVIELGGRGHRCAHLRFSCCGRQVSTFVVRESPNVTPKSFKPPETSRQVRRTARHVDGYLVVTMSHHPPTAVAGLFDDQSEDISRQ